MKFKLVAIFLIVLVLGIPIYTSKVYADYLDEESISVHGSANIDKYRKKTDTTTFEALVFADDPFEGVVRLETQGYIEDFICNPGVVGYNCVLDIPEQEWDSNKYTFPINLYTSSMELISTSYSSITIDDQGAEVISFTANKNKVALEDTLTLNYNVQDSAFIGSSGISKIDFYSDGVLIVSKDINTGSASSSGSFSVNVSELGSSGDVILGLSAYDRLGQTGEMAEYMLNIDTSGPELMGEINLTKAGNEPVVYVPSNGVNAVLKIKVVAGDFKEARVKMIELNPSYYTYGEFMKGSCVEINDFYECSWEVNVKVEESVTANLYFELEDTTGNVNELVKMYSLLVDDGPPSVTNLETNFGLGMIGLETNFTAIISENGAGFNDANIYLNLASIGKGILQANYCNETAGGWRCNWDGIVTAEGMANGVIPVNIMPSSMDDMGNYIIGKLDYNMTLDTEAPVLNGNITVIPIMGSTGYPVNITEPKTGDSLVVLVNLTDETNIEGYGDFSKVLLFDDEYNVNCVGEGTDKICVFETTQVKEGPAMGTIDFRFTDGVGNVLEKEYDLIIYGVDNQSEIVNRWYISNDYNDEKLEPKIDIETTSLITYKVHFPIDIRRAVSGYIMPVEIYDLECHDPIQEVNTTPVLTNFEEPYLLSSNCNYDNPDSIGCTNFYVVVPLKLQEYENTEHLTCSFKVISIYGNVYDRRVSAPEELSLDLEVEFGGTALGSLSDAARKKVNRVKNSAIVSGDFWKVMTTINKIAEGICSVVKTLENTATAISLIVAIFSADAKGLAKLAEDGAAENQIGAGVFDFANEKFCNYVTCSKFFGLENSAYMDAIENYLTGNSLTDKMGGLGEDISEAVSMKPKDSMVLSIVTLCIPGILNNLEKSRQIECKYVYCMESYVPNGMPSLVCTRERAISWCKYVYGEMFSLMPFSAFMDWMTNYIAEVLGSPVSAGLFTLTTVCRYEWIPGTKAFCAYTVGAERVMGLINDVMNFVEGDVQSQFGLGSQGDYCRKLKKEGFMD